MIEAASPEIIARAGALIRAGGLVAFPTETVYGLGADATSDRAVARIFEAKRRPSFNPLIVHVGDAAEAGRHVSFDGPWQAAAAALAGAFWPGALVLPRRAGSAVSLLASAGLDTIAIRVPAQETARAIIRAAGVPIAAPSANASGAVSPTRAVHVSESLGDAVDLIVDAGPCPVGIESTVVACTADGITVLRPGGIPIEDIEAVVGPVSVASGDGGNAPASPGMLESHYAPRAALRLNANSVGDGEALLSFGAHELSGFSAELSLSPSGDLREAAANLFAMLRELDHAHSAIAVGPIPDRGLGRAINDRLARAAAPRKPGGV